ncbi:hypothetical protein [Paenibacillus sp. ACRRY]|uniref:hypothetical protein n=1 Tax=Paenibacillus sp. ACRRY TaxID=2918208 RepID=UPI001EF4BEF0|nr:hypothetical protein [Paenibacillus sp. ACRRY]MCG7385056.1 hypothetical protein [Paenibacillus sp. ACRRY]
MNEYQSKLLKAAYDNYLKNSGTLTSLTVSGQRWFYYTEALIRLQDEEYVIVDENTDLETQSLDSSPLIYQLTGKGLAYCRQHY